MRSSNRARRMGRLRPGILLLAVVLLPLLLFCEIQLRPLILTYARDAARWSGTLAVETAVQQVLSGEEDLYDTLVHIRRDADGRVLSVEADIAAVNLLKARISAAILSQLDACRKRQIVVPFGSAVGGGFFTGRGPYLHFTVHISGSAVATIQSRLEQAGVNQTMHSIWLSAEVRLFAAVPGNRGSATFSSDYLLAQTVLVGDVPQTFASLEGQL